MLIQRLRAQAVKLVAAFWIACLSPASFAQVDENGKRRSQNDAEALLAGPPVVEDSQPVPNMFGTGDRKLDAIASIKVPFQRWLRLVRGTSLTEEQAQEIRLIERSFRQRVEEFRQEHGEELRTLQQNRRAAVTEQRDVDTASASRLRELAELVPREVTIQEAIWNVLDEAQQNSIRAALGNERERIYRDRQRRRAESDTMQERDSKMMQRDAAIHADENPADAKRRAIGFGRPEEAGLDDAGLKRLRFLRKFQKSRPRGAAPGDDERHIDFDDEAGSTVD